MNGYLRKLFFKKGSKPRGWFRALVLRRNGTARPLFRRAVHKKNGSVRAHFIPWVKTWQDGAGIVEGIQGPLSPAEATLRLLRPLAETARMSQNKAALPALLSAHEIGTHLAASGTGPLILSAGHDNYRIIPGGVQLCLQREEKIATTRGMTYVQFHPWRSLPCMADAALGAEYPVTLVCNGNVIGTAPLSALIEAVTQATQKGRQARLVVHHLMGHAPEGIALLAKAAGDHPTLFWLHDFFSLCPSFTLQRNTLEFCGAPDVGSNACGLCVFGAERRSHQARIETFFRQLRPIVLSPSDVTAQFWTQKVRLPYEALHVVPHLALEETAATVPPPPVHPLRIGFLGAPAVHKGWPVYAALLQKCADQDMSFIVFSAKPPNQGESEWRKVFVTAQDPDAMARAVAQCDIDLVLHWASWPETFSFTTFEAMAGGAYVLTNPVSGNVRATVERTGYGVVLPDQAALLAFFDDGSAARLAQKRRLARATTALVSQYSDLSFSVANWI